MTNRVLIIILMNVCVFGMTCSAFANDANSDHPSLAEAPAQFKTIDGMLLKIEGQSYLLLDRAGKESQIHVDKSTKRLGGEKRPGDMVRAQVTKNGYALSIQ